MKRIKEENTEEKADKIQVYQKPCQVKMMHKTRFGITKESLDLHRIKKAKACVWELNTLNTIIDDKALKILMKEMKLTKAVRRLSLNSDHHHSITNSGLSDFGNNLKSLITIKEIALDFYYRKGISDEGLYNLCKGFQRLRFLKKLRLDFSSCSCPIYSAGFYILKESLKSLTSLQMVRIDFGPCFQRDSTFFLAKRNQGPNSILEALKNCHDLKNIYLSFYRDFLKDLPFEIFSGSLRKLSSVRKISVELESSNIKDHELLCICRDFGKLDFLRVIHLNLIGCKQVTDEGIKTAKEYFGEIYSRIETLISKSPERKK